MNNLLQETITILNAYGYRPEDVVWCGSPEFGWFTWEEFATAADVDYNDGFGAATCVAKDLLIVGNSWWMERNEYDGSEWWEFKEYPSKPSTKAPISPKVVDPDSCKMFPDLSKLNISGDDT